ncbi:unnamed protein product, partial [Amoebophrya sp. A120]
FSGPGTPASFGEARGRREVFAVGQLLPAVPADRRYRRAAEVWPCASHRLRNQPEKWQHCRGSPNRSAWVKNTAKPGTARPLPKALWGGLLFFARGRGAKEAGGRCPDPARRLLVKHPCAHPRRAHWS